MTTLQLVLISFIAIALLLFAPGEVNIPLAGIAAVVCLAMEFPAASWFVLKAFGVLAACVFLLLVCLRANVLLAESRSKSTPE